MAADFYRYNHVLSPTGSHPQQPRVPCHPSGGGSPSPPSSQKKENKRKDKGKDKGKKHSVRPASGSPTPSISSGADSNSSSTSISPSLQSPGHVHPKGGHPLSGAPLRPALRLVAKATSTPISASRPSRWRLLGAGSYLSLGVGACCNWSLSGQTFSSALPVAEPLFWESDRLQALFPSHPPGRVARPVEPWGCRCRLDHGLSIHPPTDFVAAAVVVCWQRLSP